MADSDVDISDLPAPGHDEPGPDISDLPPPDGASPSAGPSTFGSSVRTLASENPVAHLAKTAEALGESGLTSLSGGVASLADALTFSDPGSHNSWIYKPKTAAGQGAQGASEKVMAPIAGAVSHTYDKSFGTGPGAQTVKEALPEFLNAAGVVVPAISESAGLMRPLRTSFVDLPPPVSPEEALAQQVATRKQNTGAAIAAPDISGVSPALRQAVVEAHQQSQLTGVPMNFDALERHRLADTLPQPDGVSPMQLRKGSATGDVQQISDEKNMRNETPTEGMLSDSITSNDAKLGSSMGEIRRRAAPDIVQRNNLEHGQSAVDAIKTTDNAAVTDMRGKYQALADANGGFMPIDTSQVVDQIDDVLGDKYLTKTAADHPDISEVMDALRNGNPVGKGQYGPPAPMTFEQFENARSSLAAVQRGGGSEAAAAGVVRNALESMPLPPGLSHLKGLADDARGAAKARFDTIEANPAYKAAINDNVPLDPETGLHVVGAPSPLADNFMNSYFTGAGDNASRAFVSRIKGVVQDPGFNRTIESASLNKLRDAAGLNQYDLGSFKNDGFRKARNAMDPKADVLLSPQSAAATDQLKQVSGFVNDEGKASVTSRSNTPLVSTDTTLQRFGASPPAAPPTIAGQVGDALTNAGIIHATGAASPAILFGKKIAQMARSNAKTEAADVARKQAIRKFAQDATKPGAGLLHHPPLNSTERAAGGRVGFASGGKIGHEALAEKLHQRFKSAVKAADRSTKPLLHVPDAHIASALKIAQAHI